MSFVRGLGIERDQSHIRVCMTAQGRKDTQMDNLEDQLNELLSQSDRVSAELKREIYLVERADAAIRYLRAAREKTAHEVAGLLAQRAHQPPDVTSLADVSTTPTACASANAGTDDVPPKPFGPYDPHWDPQWPNKQNRAR